MLRCPIRYNPTLRLHPPLLPTSTARTWLHLLNQTHWNRVKRYTSVMPASPIYFWREYEVPYGFLSQWFACPFTVDDTTYATTEMWMMVQKARMFGDAEAEQQMLATEDPETQRDLGRKVKGYDGKAWDQREYCSGLHRLYSQLMDFYNRQVSSRRGGELPQIHQDKTRRSDEDQAPCHG